MGMGGALLPPWAPQPELWIYLSLAPPRLWLGSVPASGVLVGPWLPREPRTQTARLLSRADPSARPAPPSRRASSCKPSPHRRRVIGQPRGRRRLYSTSSSATIGSFVSRSSGGASHGRL